MPSSATAAAVAVVAAALGARYASTLPSFFTSSSHTQSAYDVLDPRRLECHPFLPPVFVETPPSVEHPAIQAAAKALEDQLSSRFAVGDINSLSVAVITSGGAVYEQNFGVIRGNESEASPRTTSHSSYRIASVSKIFIAYEAFILEQKKRLSWDDRVDKHLPLFKPRLDGFNSAEPVPTLDESPITLFDLASHTSGLGRDWPPGTVANWPYDLVGGGPPPTNGLPFPSHESLYDAIARHRLTSPPAAYPAYSNTGTGVLGLALVAANRAAGGSKEPSNYADLMQRDVFGPLGMNGTHFLTIEENKHLVVVPSLAPEVADQDFLDAMNPAGGQFSSLSDMIKFTQAVLNPRSPPNLISPHSAWKWLRPVHTFEEDDWTEIGLTWEIIKQPDSHGHARKIYWKLGAMAGYHAAVAIHPGTSYGITILMAGHYPDAAKLAYDAFATFQPAFDTALEDAARTLYGGLWSAPDGHGSASIIVERGTLWLQHMTLSGVNVLERLFAPGRLPLRYSGRRDELRIDTGFPGPYNGARHMGCYPYWNGQDLWGVRSGAAINVLTFEGDGEARRMVVPALGITLVRKGT